MQNPLIVTEKVQTGIMGFHGGVEAELVNAGDLAGEIATLSVITFLSVVDDVLESNGLACCGEVVAQSDGEGNVLSSSRRRWWWWWCSGRCKGKTVSVFDNCV